MCQEIVFDGQTKDKGKGRAQDHSDSGESEINWQLEALRLSGDDEDDTYDSESGLQNPVISFNPVYHDIDDNFRIAMERVAGQVAGPLSAPQPTESVAGPVAGPSSAPQPTESLPSIPVTPQQPLKTLPVFQLAPPPKPRQRARAPIERNSLTFNFEALLPLPPPATPRRSRLDYEDFVSPNPFETSPPRPLPKKAQAQRKKSLAPPVISETQLEAIEQGPGSKGKALPTRARKGTWKKVAFVESDAAAPVPKKPRGRRSKR